MRPLALPPWFPLKTLAVQGALALGVTLFVLVPLWYQSHQVAADIADLRTRIQVQETLAPLMAGLDEKRRETRLLIGASTVLPTPASLPDIVTSIQRLVSLADIQSARFVPAAETVVEKNSIRLDGTLSAEPDQFRRLVLLLSEQPWLSGMEFLNVTPAGGAPSYSLGIWATFTQPLHTTSGH